jgi:lipopolysaccharide transport protein LptA
MSTSQNKLTLTAIFLLIFSFAARAELVDDTEEDVKPIEKAPSSALESTELGKAKPATENNPKQSHHKSGGESRSPQRPKQHGAKAGVVKFWSKSLSGFRDRGSVMLEEDVVVTQDDIRLEADKATIFFEQSGKDVKEVHAVGSVRFSRTDPETGDPIRAQGREAIFSNAKRNVTMKGEPILTRGDDVVRGKVIYYDLKNGWVKADRVEGVVQPSTKKAGIK